VFDEPVNLGEQAIQWRAASGALIQSWDAQHGAGVTVQDQDIWVSLGAEGAIESGSQWLIQAGAIQDEAANPQSSWVLAMNLTQPDAVDVVAYHWLSHEVLDLVDGSHGESLLVLTESQNSQQPGLSEAAAVDASVNLSDAIAILKMIVGLDVNGTGKALSPYQSLAADFDGNGLVQLSDAIGVLKHVVGLSAPTPAWQLVDETSVAIAEITEHPLAPGVASDLLVDGTLVEVRTHLGLVGYVRGDVNGSYAGSAGANDLDLTQPSYFQDLAAEVGLDLSQFGIYG
jgi:hypothetical protein